MSLAQIRDCNNETSAAFQLGPQYSFDLGLDDANNKHELRYVYTKVVSGVHRVYGGWCTMDGPSLICTSEPAWNGHTVPGQSDYPGDQFNPIIAYGGEDAGYRWTFSYHTRQTAPTGNAVAVWAGRLIRTPTASSNKWQVAQPTTPCTTCYGYFGDYDNIAYAGINPQDNNDREFWRPFTDSSQGCTHRGYLASEEMHVSITKIEMP